MSAWKGKTLFITGGSRGIGRAIALRFAREGANIVLAAKTTEPNPKLAGTIFSVAKEVRELGGQALECPLDVRQVEQIDEQMQKAAQHFGGIDVLINNASAIYLLDTATLSPKQLDLMWQINGRGSFLCAKAALPFLKKSPQAHILTLSPPMSFKEKWFVNHPAYTISKYTMSLCTLGLAAEFKAGKIRVNSLWPKTTIATDAIRAHFPEAILRASRKPDIVADAAYSILNKTDSFETGQFYIDEEVLRQSGLTDFKAYQMHEGIPPYPDLYIDD